MKKSLITILILVLIVICSLSVQIRAQRGIEVSDITINSHGRVLAGLFAVPAGDYGPHSLPGIAVFHGFTASKEMMRPFIEGLARVGFAVVAVDQQGHGLSTGNLGEDGNNSLRNDGVTVIQYLRGLDVVNPDNIGILGHSMGAGTAIATSMFLGNLKATILLGNSLSGQNYAFNSSRPSNILFGLGRYDELFSLDDALQSFSGLIDQPATINTLYGDFSRGTARELLVVPTDHVLEVLNPTLVETSIEWMYRSMIDSTAHLGDSALQSVNGWGFVLDQFLSYIAGLLLIGLIPLIFVYLPQNNREDKFPIQWIPQGSIAFLTFMVAIPTIVLPFGSVPLFMTWYILGFLLYSLLTSHRSSSGLADHIKSIFTPKEDSVLAIVIFFIFMGIIQLLLLTIHWDFRYVLPLLGALDLRRVGMFFMIFVPGIMYFTAEIDAMQGHLSFSAVQLGKEIFARLWVFLILLIIYYVPIIFFHTSILPPIIGFLVFFIVGLVPVMIIISVISAIGRSQHWSVLSLGIICSGLIAWILASTLSFGSFR